MLTAAVVVLLAGCAVTPPPGGQVAELPFPTFQRGNGAPDALLEGKLVLDDGCLAVDSETGVGAVVLPDSATWDADTQAVTVDRVQMVVGDQVALGGGAVHGVDLVDPDHRCVRDEAFYVYSLN